jgi:hypothetical protein
VHFADRAEIRRWQLTIAMVAALGAFVALVADSSLRPRFAASTLPEPAALPGVTPNAVARLGL